MGEHASRQSESDDTECAGFRKTKILASNSGRCMEESFEGVGLHLGAGNVRWPYPWLNVDLTDGDIQCDLRQLSIPDNYAERIAAIHVVEHFYQWEIQPLLAEWKRALKPGGKIILELPCMDKVLNYICFCMQNKIPIPSAFSWHVFWGNPKYQSELMNHKWGYTKAMIEAELHQAGFAKIELKTPNYHFPMRDMRVEAIKP